jgi:hypothetical protein
MPERMRGASLAVYGRVAGWGYLLIIVTGIFAEFFVRARLIVTDDAAATAANILASQSLFRVGIASEFVMLVCDVLLAMVLYVIFRGVRENLAMLAAFFRLAHAAIVGINLLNTYVPLQLLSDPRYSALLDADQRHALALLSLDAHGFGYVIGLVFFGVHCLVLGYVVLVSRYLPHILGLLLMVAGMGYLIDSFGRTLLSGYADHASLFALLVFVPAFVGELSFCLWLLVKGVDPPRSIGAASAAP